MKLCSIPAILTFAVLTGCPADNASDAAAGSSGEADAGEGDDDDSGGQTTTSTNPTSSGDDTGTPSDTGESPDPDCEVMLPPATRCTAQAAQAGGDTGSDPVDCNPIAQDCPDGEKCMPWADDGSSIWNATRCTPIDPDPQQIGEPCQVEGSGVSGFDNCDLGAMCWGVDLDTGTGECIEMCGCSFDNPSCQTANTACVISNAEALTVCLPVCNPLDVGACPRGEGCYPVGSLFHCAASAGAGTSPGSPCESVNECDPGQACVDATEVAGCEGQGCCADLCLLGADDCGEGTSCSPWYADGAPPDACLGQTGFCR